MEIDVQVEQSSDLTLVRVTGEVDLSTAPQLRQALDGISSGPVPLIIDLSAVTFMDSSGLSVLVESWKRLSEGEDGHQGFRLVVDRPAILRVLEVTGLDDVFGIFKSVEAAKLG